MKLKIAKTKQELRDLLKETHSKEIGFVPTMGALHKGHLSLVRSARAENEVVVVSVFVNPTQFNDPKDLTTYPRTPQADVEALAEEGVDIVFMPSEEEMYPEPDTRVFDFGVADKVMEGATRPGHFNGVAQIVSRLFEAVEPKRSYFGQKDFQQIAIIRLMVKQLALDVEIRSCPTVREDDGLAMSSRNQLMDEQHRKAAPQIYGAMSECAKLVESALSGTGNKEELPTPQEMERIVKEKIDSNSLLKVIYFKLVNGSTLEDAQSWDEPEGVVGCIAVEAGKVRLIDNIRFV